MEEMKKALELATAEHNSVMTYLGTITTAWGMVADASLMADEDEHCSDKVAEMVQKCAETLAKTFYAMCDERDKISEECAWLAAYIEDCELKSQ